MLIQCGKFWTRKKFSFNYKKVKPQARGHDWEEADIDNFRNFIERVLILQIKAFYFHICARQSNYMLNDKSMLFKQNNMN